METEYDKARNPKPTSASLTVRIDRLENALTDLSIRQNKKVETIGDEMGSKINNLSDIVECQIKRITVLEDVQSSYKGNIFNNIMDLRESVDALSQRVADNEDVIDGLSLEIGELTKPKPSQAWGSINPTSAAIGAGATDAITFTEQEGKELHGESLQPTVLLSIESCLEDVKDKLDRHSTAMELMSESIKHSTYAQHEDRAVILRALDFLKDQVSQAHNQGSSHF